MTTQQPQQPPFFFVQAAGRAAFSLAVKGSDLGQFGMVRAVASKQDPAVIYIKSPDRALLRQRLKLAGLDVETRAVKTGFAATLRHDDMFFGEWEHLKKTLESSGSKLYLVPIEDTLVMLTNLPVPM